MARGQRPRVAGPAFVLRLPGAFDLDPQPDCVQNWRIILRTSRDLHRIVAVARRRIGLALGAGQSSGEGVPANWVRRVGGGMNVAIFASAFYPHVGGVEELCRQLAHAYT